MQTNSYDYQADASILETLVSSNRSGEHCGIYAICSAHEPVLRAAFEQALEDHSPLLIEATCNQVNQDGGYTGLRPADFLNRVLRIAAECGFPTQHLLLGGDHLGPNPWRHLNAEEAMAKAEVLIDQYVRAGFSKIHLDTSMACADDPTPLPVSTIAQRAARLCKVAEHAAAAEGRREARFPRYIVGTEVPVPGGAQSHHDEAEVLTITDVADVAETYEAHRQAFIELGLQQALKRVVALVTQPGVEFDDQEVIDYQPEKAKKLSESILAFPGLVFEAHSTDYQTEQALSHLVRDHFAILKVGPGVTYAWREALFSLSMVEDEIIPDSLQRSNVRAVVEDLMLRSPGHWEGYYSGDETAKRLARRYSYSDRVRYYWQDPDICRAVAKLIANLRDTPPSETLLSQYLPQIYEARRNGLCKSDDPEQWLQYAVRHVIGIYARACGYGRVQRRAV